MSWQPDYRLTYNGQDITAEIELFVTSITFDDRLTGESDELSVELEDVDGRWLTEWYPEHGASLNLSLGYVGAPLLDVGSFDVDEIEMEGPASTVRIRALAAGLQKPVRTRRSRGYENTTLDAVVARVAKRMRIELKSEIDPIPLDRVTQYQESDLQFLNRLAEQYGYVCKIVDNNTALVFLRRDATYEAESVRTLRRPDVSSWIASDKIGEVPAMVTTQHHNPQKKALRTSKVSNGDTGLTTAGEVSSSVDELKLTQRAGSQQAADAQAKAALDKQALERTRVELTLPGDVTLLAGAMVTLADWGRLGGRYVITHASHTINRSSGYTVMMRLSRTNAAIEEEQGDEQNPA